MEGEQGQLHGSGTFVVCPSKEAGSADSRKGFPPDADTAQLASQPIAEGVGAGHGTEVSE